MRTSVISRVESEQEIGQQRSLASGKPGCGLVEHQDLRLGRERHRKRHLPLLPVRERPDELVELVRDGDTRRGRACSLPELRVALREDHRAADVHP